MSIEERAEKYSDRYPLLSVENIELIKQAYIAGYNDAIKVKVNTTRISDAPTATWEEGYRQGELDCKGTMLYQSDKIKCLEAENKIAKDLLKEICANQLMIKVHNPYADEETNKMLSNTLLRWFKRAENFLKETEE